MRARAARMGLKLVEIQSRFLRHGSNAPFFEGFDRLGREPQLHPAIALGPPDPLVLQVGMLQSLGPPMGVRDGVAVIGLLSGQLAFPRHGFLRSPWVNDDFFQTLILQDDWRKCLMF